MSCYTLKNIEHPHLYLTALIKSEALQSVLFIHGGPGLNSAPLEYLIKHEGIFDSLNYNVLLYDQRGCGRSQSVTDAVTHQDNIDDLLHLLHFLQQDQRYSIAGIIGHSYGAMLLFNLYRSHHLNLPAIFVGVADSILTPRTTNILLDFAYLKMTDQQTYRQIFEQLKNEKIDDFWSLTESLGSIFKKNTSRPFFYWANLEWKEKVEAIQKKLALPMNGKVFFQVRRDLYTHTSYLPMNFQKLSAPHLRINGFHDLVMAGPNALTQQHDPTILFSCSGHYPHIEEHQRFCVEVNNFLQQQSNKQS